MASNPFIERATCKRIKLSELRFDPKNREVKRWRVEKIKRGFTFEKWTPPIVREDADGVFWLIDGHHHVTAALELGLGEKEVICYVHPPVETDAEVGEMYLGINDTMASTSTEKFLQRVRAKDKTACAVMKIVTECGLQVSPKKGPGLLHTPTHCEWVYRGAKLRTKRESPDALAFALFALAALFGQDKPAAFSPSLIRGFGAFALRYPDVRVKGLVPKVAAEFNDPRELIREASNMATALRCEAHEAVARVLQRSYNVGRRSGALPEWR